MDIISSANDDSGPQSRTLLSLAHGPHAGRVDVLLIACTELSVPRQDRPGLPHARRARSSRDRAVRIVGNPLSTRNCAAFPLTVKQAGRRTTTAWRPSSEQISNYSRSTGQVDDLVISEICPGCFGST